MNVRVAVKFDEIDSSGTKPIAYIDKKTGELIETKKCAGILAEQWDKYICGRLIYHADTGQTGVYVKESGNFIAVPTYVLSKQVEIPAVDVIGKWSE